jgi:hypothetical protein
MTLRYLILGASALLLGFLFYPRGGEHAVSHQHVIKPVRVHDNEPLHYTDILRTEPIYATYDLGYVYKIDRAETLFENADENGPKQYDILVHIDRTKPLFNRAFSFNGSSREYTYTWQTFPFPVEARWIQVVVNDWFSSKPKIQRDGFRVGILYQSHSPIQFIRANYNEAEASKLIDLLPFEDSVWRGAERNEKEVEGEDGKKKTEITYKTPSGAVKAIGDLGAIQQIYGVSITTDGLGNNLKRCHILVSDDGGGYKPVYTSGVFPDETVTDLHLFDPPLSGRYVLLQVDEGDWYGDYPEIREFEVFTDAYRLPPSESGVSREMNDYNAVQIHYENLGEENNAFAPHLVAGFPFDRDTGDKSRYFLLEGEESDKVSPGNTSGQRSFAYHYDAVQIQYTGLTPAHRYWAQVAYLQEKGGTRVQNLTVDGLILHDAMTLPKEKAGVYTYFIPTEAYADGEILLSFNRLDGPNAAVSEVSLFEARPTKEADLASARAAGLDDRVIGRAIQRSEKVVIDGKVDEWPLLYPMLPQKYRNSVDAPVAAYAQWDAENLYMAAIVNRQGNIIGESQASFY